MELTMIKLKVLSTVAAIALVLPMAVPTASSAQHFRGGRAGVAVGGGGPAPAARFSAGAAPMAHYSGPGASSMARYSGGYGGWNGGYRYRHRGFFPGAVAGAVIGGALASSYAYGWPGYDDYAYGYDDPYYYDDAAVVAAVPAPVGEDADGYCMQTYQSYDPASGTYLGYDGLRHPCP